MIENTGANNTSIAVYNIALLLSGDEAGVVGV
jgi:hypothetical protein